METISLCSTHQREKRTSVPRACSTCTRINIERDIVIKTLETLLAAGYALEFDYINDESGGKASPLRDIATLKTQAMACDDERLYVYAPSASDMRRPEGGWVYFVYGNDGWDVISDYTTNLEDVLKPVNDYAEAMQ